MTDTNANDNSTGGDGQLNPRPTVGEYADLQWAYGFLEAVNNRVSELDDGELKPALKRMQPYLQSDSSGEP